MNYSTRALQVELACDEDGCIIDVHSLCARYGQLRDGRDRRGLQYPLAVVLTVYSLAKLAGEDKLAGVAAWARLRQTWLADVFQLKRARMPHATTLSRILGQSVTVSELQQVLSDFLQETPQSRQSVVVSVDGKRLRGSVPIGQEKGVYLLAAYLPQAGVVLMQVEVAPHQSELSVAPQLLEMLDLQGKIVTGDALFTQRALSVQIVKAGGEYLWQAKDNQLHLRQAIEQLFEPEVYAKGFSPGPTDFRSAHTLEKGHGRLEERTLTASSLLSDYLDWPYVEQVFKLERRLTNLKTQRTSDEVSYGLTSLTAEEASPARLLQLRRWHWGIENGLHYRRDVTCHEDAVRTQNPRLAQIMAMINNLLIGLTQREGLPNLAHARRYFNAHPDRALSLLFR